MGERPMRQIADMSDLARRELEVQGEGHGIENIRLADAIRTDDAGQLGEWPDKLRLMLTVQVAGERLEIGELD